MAKSMKWIDENQKSKTGCMEGAIFYCIVTLSLWKAGEIILYIANAIMFYEKMQ